MSSQFSIVRQDSEEFDTLKPIEIGVAKQLSSNPPGLLKFEFDRGHERKTYTFDWVSSVLYVDELLCNEDNFPYAYTVGYSPGLYECTGSTYIKRIRETIISGGTFKHHRHYIYWDIEFSWHITCEGISLVIQP